ncbi:MAG: hypothetical protein V4692_13935 [Bdellovibrionota bacterium]
MKSFAGGGGTSKFQFQCLDGSKKDSGLKCVNETYVNYNCGLKSDENFLGQVKTIDFTVRRSTVNSKVKYFANLLGNFPSYQGSLFNLPTKVAAATYALVDLRGVEGGSAIDLNIEILANGKSARIDGLNNGRSIDQVVACKVSKRKQ